jgi:hypothetical protein
MLSFDIVNKFSLSSKSISILVIFLNRAVMWTIILMRDCEVCLKIFNRIKRFLDYISMNIALIGLHNIYKIRMPSLDVLVKFVFPRKSKRATNIAGIRAFKCTFL